jgi:5-methylcytosine-specific restriction endonuclease McrA
VIDVSRVAQSKACSRCGKIKPLEEYHVHSKRKDGRTARCKECAKQIAREWYASNTQRHKKASVAYAKSNRERLREAKRRNEAANRERVRERHEAWKIANPEAVRVSALFSRMNRRAEKFGVASYFISVNDRRALLAGRCAVDGCHDDNLQVDHIIPLSRGGVNAIGNLQILCRSHNRMKANRTWMEFRVLLKSREARASN